MIIDYNELIDVNLRSLSNLIREDEFRSYFCNKPGEEHYRLLAYLSTKFNNTTILDIGTFKGCSAIALSYNKNNFIKSFDLIDCKQIKEIPKNVEFIIGDFTDNIYKQLVLDTPLIILDTNHTGDFEYKVYNYLKEINWVGYLILDDIYLNDEMKSFWNDISNEKYDITKYGHWSGTGLVIF